MTLSVVLPTHNQRDELVGCLDTLSEKTTDIEIVVVNGPSSDGTSGLARERDDVDILLECSSRNLSVARNAGVRAANAAQIAFLAPTYRITDRWQSAIETTLGPTVGAISGPVRPETTEGDHPTEGFALTSGNLALTRSTITALDGFDEYLHVGGAADLGARIQGQGLHVMWHPEMAVESTKTEVDERPRDPTGADSWYHAEEPDWELRYRTHAYREVKLNGARPGVLARLAVSALRDGMTAGIELTRGRDTASNWLGSGVAVLKGMVRGIRDGRAAARADPTAARNPNGLSNEETTQSIADQYG